MWKSIFKKKKWSNGSLSNLYKVTCHWLGQNLNPGYVIQESPDSPLNRIAVQHSFQTLSLYFFNFFAFFLTVFYENYQLRLYFWNPFYDTFIRKSFQLEEKSFGHTFIYSRKAGVRWMIFSLCLSPLEGYSRKLEEYCLCSSSFSRNSSYTSNFQFRRS